MMQRLSEIAGGLLLFLPIEALGAEQIYRNMDEFWPGVTRIWILFLLTWGVREWVKEAAWFYLAHGVLAALWIWISRSFFAWDSVTLAVGVIVFLYSVTIMLIFPMGNGDQPGRVRIGILAGICLLAEVLKLPFTVSVAFWSCIGYTMAYVMDFNLSAAADYLSLRQRNSKMDASSMKRIQKMVTAVYVLLMAGVMLMASRLPVEGFLGGLWLGIRSVLRWFFSLFRGKTPASAPPEPETAAPMMPEIPESGTPSRFMEILQQILTYTAYVAAILLAVALVCFVIYRLYHGFQPKVQEGEDEKDYLNPFDQTTSLHSGRKRRNLGAFLSRNPNQRARRYYRKRMKGFWVGTDTEPQTTTPQMQAECMDRKGERISEDCTELYEKARYSQRELRDEEIKKLKKELEM